MSLALDAWWDEPGYHAARGFSIKGAFILRKLADHDAAKLKGPADMTKFEWEIILRFLGASADEIKDVQRRMGRVWR